MITIKQARWRSPVIYGLVFTLTLLGAALLTAKLTQTSDAASGKDFNPGRIIDDAVFYNSTAMDTAQVQQFLNSKVPTCDTNGQQLSEFGGPDLNGDGKVQRWEWGQSTYGQSVFTCLKDYSQNTPGMAAASGLCGSITSGTKSAAQIINDIAKACNINPQVLLVLLNKEQSLVTDTWPLKQQYDGATGFDCPDTAPCDPNYAGFFYQVYYAARQFQIYKTQPNNFNYIAGRNNNIYWNPDLSRCGSSTVFIQNQATAALYIYTPYQPNQAALDNLYGLGDSCSAYGNRNFWRMFTDWFGSTVNKPLPECTTSGISCVYEFINQDTQKSFYTSDITERDQVNKGNFTFIGIAFHTRRATDANVIPVSRLYNSSQNFHLWTSNQTEKSNLLAVGGWADEGIKFYMDSVEANSGPAVYRLYSQAGTGRHILSSNAFEIEKLQKQGYTNEGPVFRTPSLRSTPSAPSTGKLNTYRFYFEGRHFWTNSLEERETLIDRGLTYEGIVWESLKSSSVPIHRVYSPTGYHFWTTSSNERDSLIRAGWKNEGTALYGAESGQATYRFYNKLTGKHIFTTSVPERTTLLSDNNWRDEGIAWYQ